MSAGIPILMYHALPAATDATMHRVQVAAADFRQQMQWLATNGYHAITVHKAVTLLKGKWACDKYVVLTFDDGFSSVYKEAYPVLQQHGFAATLYLVADVLNKPDFTGVPGFDAAPPDDRPMTTAEVKELVASGWEVGAHSCTHANHQQLNKTQLTHEIADSKAILAAEFNVEVLSYAFPFGNYTYPALALLTTAGYQSGLSVHSGKAGYNSDFRRMKRIEINAEDTPTTFARKVKTGYTSFPQQLKSKLRDLLFSSPAVKDRLQRK